MPVLVTVAVGDVMDVDRLATAMSGAQTVCHLVGEVELSDEDSYRSANLASTEAMLDAAGRAGVAGSCSSPPREPHPPLRTRTPGRRGRPRKRSGARGSSTP